MEDKWNADRWIAFAAATAAVAALSLSLWQGYLDRKYRRLELRPKITVSFFYNHEGSGFRFGNFGPGPGIVRWTRVLVDGVPVPTWLHMGGALGLKSKPHFEFIVPKHNWEPGSSSKIFWANPGDLDAELRTVSGRIEIEACYCSILDDCWRVSRTEPDAKPVNSCQPIPKDHLRSPGPPPAPPDKLLESDTAAPGH